MRDEIIRERSVYMAAFNRPPTLLFLSPEAYAELLVWVWSRLAEYRKSIVGAKFCGMTVHLVPTLETGFYVA